MKQIVTSILFATIFYVTAFTTTSQSQTITFNIKSLHPNIVSVEFYSQSRDYAWPGGDQVYTLEDSNFHSFKLSCNSGEKICYGAWVRNVDSTYWGIGKSNSQYCTDCCGYCDGQTVIDRTLEP